MTTQMQHQSKKYKVILADPPWDVQQKGKHGAIKHYNLMTLDQIKSMPIADLADENSACVLWVTNATMEAGFDVLRAWGFKPTTSIFTYLKGGNLGLGHWLRSNTEHVLIGIHGKLDRKVKNQPNWGFYPRLEHSHKPEEFFETVERLFDGPYLELFARRPRHGWDSWGNEIASPCIIPNYPVPNYVENPIDFTPREGCDEN